MVQSREQETPENSLHPSFCTDSVMPFSEPIRFLINVRELGEEYKKNFKGFSDYPVYFTLRIYECKVDALGREWLIKLFAESLHPKKQ